MIFYFSATGNSRYVASEIGRGLGEVTVDIVRMDESVDVFSGESFGIVCPVYAWGIPEPVLHFINQLPESFVEELRIGQKMVWIVLTCGDDTGMAPEMLKSAFKKRNLKVSSVYSIQMPNTYVILPGFEVDSEELVLKKIKDSRARIDEILVGLHQGRETIDVVRGSLPRLKSALYPLKGIWASKGTNWHHTEKCIGCGKCAEVCCVSNISMIGEYGKKRPIWGVNCCSCLACYHYCPVHAAEYKKITRKKGQYYFGKYNKR